METDIVILAAGKGKRMNSRLAKVLHTLAGKPLLGHVLDTAATLDNHRITVVVGHGADDVRAAFADRDVRWVEQAEQLGTGDAVARALPHLRDDSVVLVLYGDVPLIGHRTLEKMVGTASDETLAVLTVELDDPAGYGRIVRDEAGQVREIVEEKDATDDERLIREINTGVLAATGERLREWLPRLDNNNAQGEYYLTDLVAMARADRVAIRALHPDSVLEIEGVNSREQLQGLERHYQRELARELMAAGVGLADAGRFDCRGRLTAGADTFIDVNCVFEGEVHLGTGVTIGPNCVISNATIGDGVTIKANTLIEGPVTIDNGVEVGPFARLRAGTVLHRDSKVGNFVETKKAEIGRGSKVNHLSYVGDARLGEGVNVGAGTITCNYDGANKHLTEIDDGAFIGSNSALVAPVRIGRGATVGAGSAISRDVPEQNLAVARGRQKNIADWQRPVKAKKD
jgi:bifunctional UDP-N-acetylglucosamine pyrophosphorylase/glucosamine-1-phosphate N-acetyltransferase